MLTCAGQSYPSVSSTCSTALIASSLSTVEAPSKVSTASSHSEIALLWKPLSSGFLDRNIDKGDSNGSSCFHASRSIGGPYLAICSCRQFSSSCLILLASSLSWSWVSSCRKSSMRNALLLSRERRSRACALSWSSTGDGMVSGVPGGAWNPVGCSLSGYIFIRLNVKI